MIQMYKVLIVMAFICISLSIFKRPRKMKLKNFNNLRKENILLKRFDKVICKSNHINRIKEKYISKLQLINFKPYELNNELIFKYFVFDIALSSLLLLCLSRIITMWYAVITISFVFFYIIIFFGISNIESKINKINSQFPAALQCFLDEYIITKNIENAIKASYNKMPDAVGGAFELLARQISGEGNPEVTIKNFANELSYVWGYCFAEILIMSYEGAGDITDDLLTLNSMVSEEITAEEGDKSSRYGNKMTFIIIYAFALVGIIINLFKNDLARHLYFYTNAGNKLIAVWLIILIVGITVISISERGR